MAISLTLEGVGARYGTRLIFQGISLTVQQGEVLVIRGANGSGKSTFLRVLCGLHQRIEGNVWYTYRGESVSPRDASALLGWVSPDLMLYRELSGRENLRFFARVRGQSISDAAIDELLVRVGLDRRGDDRVAAYSSGMVQRLRYAYALLHQPRVLLLDEPTVTLDARGKAVVETIIAAQRACGLVILATNEAQEYSLGDAILTLHPISSP